MKQLLIVLLVTAMGCKDKPKPVSTPKEIAHPIEHASAEHYPQILENGCGKYVVRWWDLIVNKDTTFYYIGLQSQQVSEGYWSFGGPSYDDRSPLQRYKDNGHNRIWGGDTIFNAKQPLLFSTLKQAEHAISGGHHREQVEKDFLDSIINCNTYHKIK